MRWRRAHALTEKLAPSRWWHPITGNGHGRVERIVSQTLLRKWAYPMPYRNLDARAADLLRWLRH